MTDLPNPWLLLPSIIPLIGVYVSHQGLKKQIKNSPKVAEEYLKVLLELLENLDILKEGLRYRGKYCPIIEHRCPTLSPNDGEGDFSYAQRAHFFRSIGRKAIRNCRQIICLTSEDDLRGIQRQVKEIKKYLLGSDSEKKNTLELIEQCLLTLISEKGQVNPSAIDDCDE